MVYTHTHKHTMEYYSHRKENEISPFAATWLNLKGLMPSEISQRKTIIVWYHLYMQFFKCNKQVSMLTKKKKKKTDSQIQRTSQWLPVAGRGNIGVGKIQTIGYKIGSRMYCTTWGI